MATEPHLNVAGSPAVASLGANQVTWLTAIFAVSGTFTGQRDAFTIGIIGDGNQSLSSFSNLTADCMEIGTATEANPGLCTL